MKITGKHKKSYDKDFWEILFAELISVTGGIIAGLILTKITNVLSIIPTILILIPGFLEMKGNISGSLAARLSVKLHLKKFENKFNKYYILKENIIACIILTILISAVLGLIAFIAQYYFYEIFSFKIITIAILAGLLSLILEIPIVIFTSLWLFKHGYDPDDIMGPYVTTIGDILSMLSLVLVIYLLI